jgi:hypothetical protein
MKLLILNILLITLYSCKSTFVGKYTNGDCFNPGHWSNMETGEPSKGMGNNVLTIVQKNTKQQYYTVRVYSSANKKFIEGGFGMPEHQLDTLGKIRCPFKYKENL